MCDECGVEILLQLSSCNILGERNDVIEYLEWFQAERQGTNKNDKKILSLN